MSGKYEDSEGIVTTRANLRDAIWDAIAVAFADPSVSGPAPREITVCRLVGEVIQRVKARDRAA